jgi:methylmalonyl-CoA mutase cobalamin-binding domain/chain
VVGDLYDKKKYFLPQLIAGANAMELGMKHIEPLLTSEDSDAKATIVIATVEGDIHDIGKNLVALMLKNYGYNVIDLGKDVPADVIIDKAVEVDADIIGLSALMTTTMMRMDDVVKLAKENKNIVGVKDATGNFSQLVKMQSLADGCIDVYSGNDDQVVPLLSLGGKGVISVLSNVAPKQTHDMCAKFFEGDVEGAREIQLKALPLINALFCEVNPIPVKKAMALQGQAAGPLRMPLTEIEPEHVKILENAMKEFGVL